MTALVPKPKNQGVLLRVHPSSGKKKPAQKDRFTDFKTEQISLSSEARWILTILSRSAQKHWSRFSQQNFAFRFFRQN
jgi:hypothetical protein